jgi:hypothetical protein
MMNPISSLAEYLCDLDPYFLDRQQSQWFERLRSKVKAGLSIFDNAPDSLRKALENEFSKRIRTEELKAWYGAPESTTLFQGTSISSLTIPAEFVDPLNINSVFFLEDSIAQSYIEHHDKYSSAVQNAIIENVDDWIESGLFYSIAIGAKVVSQAFNLLAPHENVVFKVRGIDVDPHEIVSYTPEVRAEYFNEAKEQITCFKNLDLRQEEFESSLVLADYSKPKIERFRECILLAPIRCNEIAALLAKNIKRKIIDKTNGRIKPKSLGVVIYDTDSPYAYQHIQSIGGDLRPPIFPGLTVLGASGTIDSFRWLYAYRNSLIAQKIMKSSLYSEVHRKFIPFVFFGVLVPRDAEILLDMSRLDIVRYKGNLSSNLEYLYILKDIADYLDRKSTGTIDDELNYRTI